MYHFVIRMKFSKRNIIILVLMFCVLGRAAISIIPFDGRDFSGSDHYHHIYIIETLAEKGWISWDYSWYGGSPFLRFYPPFGLWIGSIFAHIMDALDAYKLILLLVFSLTPLAAYFFFKEFFKKTKEVLFSTLLFSFTVYYAWMQNVGEFPTIFTLLLTILFLTFFIKYLKNRMIKNFILASILLGAMAISHLLATYVAILLSFIYLVTFFVNKHFEFKRFVSSLGIYLLGFSLAAFWLIPTISELGRTSFTTQYSAPPMFSLTIVNFLKVYSYSAYFNFIPMLATVLGGVLLLYGIKKSLKWNGDDLFLLLSLAVFVAVYFGLESLFPFAYFPFGRWMAFMPIITTILITKSLNKRLFAYLALIFLASQLIIFLALPVNTYNIDSHKKVAEYLDSKDGRTIYIPRFKPNNDLDTTFDYLLPHHKNEDGVGFWPQGQSPKRYVLSLDIDTYVCEASVKPPNLLDFSIRKTDEVIEGIKCTRRENSSDMLYMLQNVRYVIVNDQFPDILSRFENDSNFTKIKQIDNFTIMELNNSAYIRTDPRVEWNYTKETDRIEINLSSKERLHNVSVMISESWYPNWKSQEVNIEPNELDFMTFKLSELEGSKHVTIEFVKPIYYPMGTGVTLIAFAVIVYLFIINKKELLMPKS